MRFTIILLIILGFSLPALAQEHDCMSKCVARGGLPHVCTEQCGITTHGSVNMPEDEDVVTRTLNKKLSNIGHINDEGKYEDAFEKCYEEQCLQGRSDRDVEECIKNCTEISIIKSSQKSEHNDNTEIYLEGAEPPSVPQPASQPAPSQAADFNGVDFGCFRTCRAEGDSFDACRTMCKK